MANENGISAHERILPEPPVFDYIDVSILVNGSKISALYELKSVYLISEVNRIPVARIELKDGDLAAETFEASESADFIPGNKIDIQVGRDGKVKSLFKGIIIKQSIRSGHEGNSSLKLECRDEAFKLTLGRKNKFFENKKDSEVIAELLNGHLGNVVATTVVHKQLVQFHSSDWDFILSRAEINGKLVLVKEGKVDIISPKIAGTPVIAVVYGSTVEEFEAEIDARTQLQSVKASSWDYSKQGLFESQSGSSDFEEAGNLKGSALASAVAPGTLELKHSGLLDTDELQAWSEASMQKSRMSKIRGHVKIQGSYAVSPGDTIALKGMGARFNGSVFVSGVSHELIEGLWYTQLQFGTSPDWFSYQQDIIEKPAAGLLPAVNGLQIGIVMQLQEDPDGEHRILVKLPLADNNAKGIWARMASLDAGKNRGYYFRPEIGDEVIVGFVNDDPRFAVVLGMLHSSANPAPYTAQDSNHIKGLVTRSELKTTYDDENKIIRIETPAGNFLDLSEKDKAISIQDQNGNSIKMDSNGIVIKSVADIKMEAGAAFSQKATGEFKTEALSIQQKASTTIELDGPAGAKLNSSGITEVKGSMVKIN
jgi:Rhs element Vgr protein